MEIINKVNCFLFPNDEVHSHFIICYRLIKTVKNLCLNHNIKVLIDLCKIMKIPLNYSFIDTCNMLLEKLTNLATISSEYVIYKALNMPYIEKDNYVIVCASIGRSEIEYFSFTTGERIKVIDSSHHTDIGQLSRINNILVSCSGFDEKNYHTVEFFDITTGTLLHFIKINDSTYISSNNNILAIATFDQTILYDTISDTIIDTFNIGGPIYLTKELLIGWSDGRIIILDLITKKPIWTIESEEFPSTICVFNNMLIYGGDGDDYNIMIFDMKTWKPVKILKGHTEGISSLLLNNDILISGSIDKTIKFWNIKTGNIIKTLQLTERPVTLHLKGNYLISGDWDNKISIWDLSIDKIVKTITTVGWVSSVLLVNLRYATVN